jgi:hypothetical protein
MNERERKEDIRRETLRFLADRSAVAQSSTAIANGLERRHGTGQVTEHELAAALVFLETAKIDGEPMIRRIASPMGSRGILAGDGRRNTFQRTQSLNTNA